MIRYVLFALLSFVQAIFLSDLICSSLWSRAESTRRHRLVAGGILLLTLLGILPAMVRWSIPCTFLCVLLIGFLYEMRWYWHICHMAIFFLLLGAVELAVGGCMALMWDISFTKVTEILVPGTLLFQTGQNLCIFLTAFLFRSFQLLWKRRAPSENPRLLALSLALPAGSCVIVFFLSQLLPDVEDAGIIVTVLLVYLLLFLMNVFLIELLERAGQIRAKQQKQAEAQSELYREVEYYRQLIRRHREASLAMRDLRNQLTVGQSLLREGKTGEATALLERIASGDRFRSGKRYSGHAAIDAVLQSKERRMRENAISFVPNITMPESCAVASEDLAIVVGNMIDNAIRACEGIPERERRTIRFTVKQFQEYLCFKTENPAAAAQQEPEHRTPVFPVRGFGLQNVRRIAEKYSGNMKTLLEGGAFSATVLLHNGGGRQDV